MATELPEVRFVKPISSHPDPSSKRSNSKLTSQQGHSPLAPRAKTPPSSPFSLPRSATATNLSCSLQVRPPLPHTDPLPTDRGALEGLLNHHASELKKLADQVESMNEWIEMNGIVVERLLSDVRYNVEKEAADRAAAVRPPIIMKAFRERLEADNFQIELDAGPVGPSLTPSPQQYRGRNISSSHHRTPTVHFLTPESRSSSEAETTLEDKIQANCDIQDLKERIKSTKRWRKELERSVYWRREEYWGCQM